MDPATRAPATGSHHRRRHRRPCPRPLAGPLRVGDRRRGAGGGRARGGSEHRRARSRPRGDPADGPRAGRPRRDDGRGGHPLRDRRRSEPSPSSPRAPHRAEARRRRSRSCARTWQTCWSRGRETGPTTSSTTASSACATREVMCGWPWSAAPSVRSTSSWPPTGCTRRRGRSSSGRRPRSRPLGLQMAWLTIDRIDTDDQWWRWFNAPGGRVVTLRPDNVGTTRAALSFRDAPAGAEHLPREQQRQLLVDVFAGAGWQSERVLDGVRHSPDFYLEAVAQVHVPPVEPRPGGPARRRCLRPVTGQWHGHEPRARRRLRARR